MILQENISYLFTALCKVKIYWEEKKIDVKCYLDSLEILQKDIVKMIRSS